MNLEYYLKRMKRLLKLQNIYLKDRKVNKIKQVVHLIEQFSEVTQKAFGRQINFTKKEMDTLQEVSSLHQVNKAILQAYGDISSRWFGSLKQEPLIYNKNGKKVATDKVLYSTIA